VNQKVVLEIDRECMKGLSYADQDLQFNQHILFLKEIIINYLGWKLISVNGHIYQDYSSSSGHNNCDNSQMMTDSMLKLSPTKYEELKTPQCKANNSGGNSFHSHSQMIPQSEFHGKIEKVKVSTSKNKSN